LCRLDRSKRGTPFERLTQLYLQTSPEYVAQLQNVWLLNEVPESVSARLNLPRQDEGMTS
jgi:predicted helicase